MPLSELLALFGPSLVALAAVALAAPLIGAFLYARGTPFHGLVLPELATFGVALGYVVTPWLRDGDHGAHGAHGGEHMHAVAVSDATHLGFAALGVLVGLGVLTWLARRPGSESARLAGAFAIASGGTALCAQLSPYGLLHVGALMGGEALAVGRTDAWIVSVVALGAAGFVAWRWRDLTLALHDRGFATALGVRVVALDAALGLATAAVVVVGTLSLGPLPLFALLVLPPLGARRGARSMARFLVRSALAGLVGAGAGAGLSFGVDLPLGASVVAGTAAVAAVLPRGGAA